MVSFNLGHLYIYTEMWSVKTAEC